MPPLCASVWLYGPPEVAAGSDVVVTAGTALIVKVKVLVAEEESVSVTRSVKLTVPAAGGVPLSTPALVMVSHAGSVRPIVGHSERARAARHGDGLRVRPTHGPRRQQ